MPRCDWNTVCPGGAIPASDMSGTLSGPIYRFARAAARRNSWRMSRTSQLHVLRVFVDDHGRHGNPLGVFLDGHDIAPDRRQRIAAELGFSETVFLEDRKTGELRIFTPSMELPLAGH